MSPIATGAPALRAAYEAAPRCTHPAGQRGRQPPGTLAKPKFRRTRRSPLRSLTRGAALAARPAQGRSPAPDIPPAAPGLTGPTATCRRLGGAPLPGVCTRRRRRPRRSPPSFPPSLKQPPGPARRPPGARPEGRGLPAPSAPSPQQDRAAPSRSRRPPAPPPARPAGPPAFPPPLGAAEAPEAGERSSAHLPVCAYKMAARSEKREAVPRPPLTAGPSRGCPRRAWGKIPRRRLAACLPARGKSREGRSCTLILVNNHGTRRAEVWPFRRSRDKCRFSSWLCRETGLGEVWQRGWRGSGKTSQATVRDPEEWVLWWSGWPAVRLVM